MTRLTLFSTLILTLLIQTSAANASPQIGDHVRYKRTLKDSRQLQVSTLEKKLTAFYSDKKTYQVSEVLVAPGYQDKITIYEQSGAELLEEAQVFAECALYGGTPQTVQVEAGRFASCRIEIDSEEEKGTAWYGEVPFGLIKKDVKLFGTNVSEVTELQSVLQSVL